MLKDDAQHAEEAWEESQIAPSDLYHTEFKRTLFGGYHQGEVDAFRDHVAEVFESLMEQSRGAKQRVGELEKEVASFYEIEEALRNALKSSQKFSETMLESAKREADALLAEASLARARAQNQSMELPESLRVEIRELRAQRDRLRADLASVLDSHRSLIQGIVSAEEQTDAVLNDAVEAQLAQEERSEKKDEREVVANILMENDTEPVEGQLTDDGEGVA